MPTEIGTSVSVLEALLRSEATIAVPVRVRISASRPTLTSGLARATSIALWLASVRALTSRARAAMRCVDTQPVRTTATGSVAAQAADMRLTERTADVLPSSMLAR